MLPLHHTLRRPVPQRVVQRIIDAHPQVRRTLIMSHNKLIGQ